MQTKPTVTGGFNGNIFSIMAACQSALNRADRREDAKTMVKRITEGEDVEYDQAIAICQEYVNIDV